MSRVIDGDSFTVESPGGEAEVRLSGVNAPEAGECFHGEAAERLTRILSGETAALERRGADRFGRALAHVFVGDLHVNADMVAGGFAVASAPGEDSLHGAALLEAESAAWKSGSGLWAPDACGASEPPPPVEIVSVEHNPKGPDDEDLEAERVTIANRGAAAVNLGGWALRDESSLHRYRFADDARLAPGESKTVSSADPGWEPGGGPVWSNSGDLALLLDDQGRVVARRRYRRRERSRSRRLLLLP